MVQGNQLFSFFQAGLACLFLIFVSLSVVHAKQVNVYGNINSTTYPFYIKDQCICPPAWTNNQTKWFDDKNMPRTNITRRYNFTISRGVASPDGYQKQVILVNGQFPGPMIQANWGDWIEVTINNKINNPAEGTAMHWHGFFQKERPWMDGVPSVSQCPIAPNASYTYKFRADRFGSSWYHSHYSAQYAGGLLGPMIIHGPSQIPYDIDIGHVFISDWYHKEYFDIIEDIMSTDNKRWDLYSQNNLIQGKGTFDCKQATDNATCDPQKAGNAQFTFTSGKTHRLRLVNGGGEGLQFFSIDGHNLTVIANDFVPIEPYNTTVVTLGVGQRADVLVHGIGNPEAAFWMRSNISHICGRSQNENALAAIYYEKADNTSEPKSDPWPFEDDGLCGNDALEKTIPYHAEKGIVTPDTTVVYNINKTINSTGHQEWQVNGAAFHADYNDPLLLLTEKRNDSYNISPKSNIYDFGANKTVRMIINNLSPSELKVSHPMHLHGHDFQVIKFGNGTWDGKTTVRPENPMRRDTAQLPRTGHLVIDVVMNNPGVWPLHCHIAWHVSEGLYVNVVDNLASFKHKNVSKTMDKTCKAWGAFTNVNRVDEIDSGL